MIDGLPVVDAHMHVPRLSTVSSKGAWRWIESAQYRLLRHGAHRALSAVDLLICATAAHHDLAVLHDDNDFAVAAQHVPDLRERSIRAAPDDRVP